jgi:hypothetical protein
VPRQIGSSPAGFQPLLEPSIASAASGRYQVRMRILPARRDLERPLFFLFFLGPFPTRP